MKRWWLYLLLCIVVVIVAAAGWYLLAHWDNPKYSQQEIEALVKKGLEGQGVHGHPIGSVDWVVSPQYAGKGLWEGGARVSFAIPPDGTDWSVSWAYHERLKIVEITHVYNSSIPNYNPFRYPAVPPVTLSPNNPFQP